MTALKERLKSKIEEINDVDFLEDLSGLIDNQQDVYILSAKEREAISKAQMQATTGDVISNEGMKSKSEGWL